MKHIKKINIMKQYIDKDDLVAEIEKELNTTKKYSTEYVNGKKYALKKILSFLDTLKVKETGTENHINCKVGWYDGVFLDYTQEQLSTLLDKIGANVGDEVKIYITK